MSRKAVSGTMLTLLLIGMSTLIISGPTTFEGNPPTKVSISPSSLTGPPRWIDVNDTFTVNVTVSDVTDLFYWQAGLSFNPTVLQCVNFTEDPFLKAGGDTVWQPGTIDNEEGLITPHGATLVDGVGVSGNGTLAFIAFMVKDAGTSRLHLEDVILLDSDYGKIKPVVLKHGHFNLPPSPEPKPPSAYFFYYPLTPYVNETVTFNASESTPNGGTIENYEWDFDDGSQGQGMIVNHTYTSPGEYNVTLTVTDNENLTDTFSRLVTVLPLLLGASIDVYTQRDGKGLNESSDAFAPQELMALTAYLSYNGTPVADKLVTFRVYLPNGTMVFSRASETDDNGLAFITYGIPSKPVFGLYSINARASVEGETVSDMLWFRVGWLVEVLEVLPCDRNGDRKNQFEMGEPLYFRVRLANIRFDPTSATLTVAVLDELLQPIIFYAEEYIIPTNQTTVLLNPSTIPEWAYVGNATAHVLALQWLLGPAYCPEVSAWFMITPPTPDVAVVGVTTSSFEIYVGQSVNITVSALNEYYRPQSFNVTIYANTTVIQTLTISNLTPYIQTNFTFIWDTHTVSLGNYIISVWASAVPGETDKADNTYINGIVKILQPPGIHAKTVVGQGSLCEINVTFTNEGNFTETFNVTLYADKNTTIIGDEITIGIQNVTLANGNSTTITFTWNTTGVALGKYTITAKTTPIPDETDLTDGTVLITIPGDVNGDRMVDMADKDLINYYFGEPCAVYPNADANCDCMIDMADIDLFNFHFGDNW